MKTLKQKIIVQLFIIYLRYLIGGAFVFASIVKIKGERFTTIDGSDSPMNSPFHLLETLFQSGLYWKFLGAGQAVAGFLLMTQRYAKLGALMFLPIIANIFVITVSYNFTGTYYITGLMLLANILLVLWDWNELKILININPVLQNRNIWMNDKVWEITGLALFVFDAAYRFFTAGYNIFLWFGICCLIALTGLIIGLKRKSLYINPEIITNKNIPA
ncbi:MAG TPA: hypothetical protein PKC91_02405 [Ignavibacteria bacterium]|nr:hypothetical protein [Ignavibacteria bacterium]